MVVHCLSIAALTCPAADVLFELFKTGFNFPTRPIILDELCYRKRQVSGEHRYPLCLTEHPNDTDRTFERLQHDHLIISTNVPAFTVEIDGISLRFVPDLSRHLGGRSQTFAIIAVGASLPRPGSVRLGIQYVIAAQPG